MKWNISSNSFLDSTSLYHQIEVDNHYTILVKYVLMLLLWIFCYLADDEAPILNCPNISSTTDEGLNSSSTVLLSSTATDNVDFHLDVICSHSSEDIFLIGDTDCELFIYRCYRKHWHLSSRCHSNRCEYDYFLCRKVSSPLRFRILRFWISF